MNRNSLKYAVLILCFLNVLIISLVASKSLEQPTAYILLQAQNVTTSPLSSASNSNYSYSLIISVIAIIVSSASAIIAYFSTRTARENLSLNVFTKTLDELGKPE